MSKYISKSRRKVTVSSMPGVWMTASDITANRSNQMRRRAAGEPMEVITSRLTWDSITVTRMWNPDTDQAIWAELNRGNPYNGTTVTIVDLDTDDVPVGTPDSYAGCAVESFTRTGSDANADDEIVELSVTFSVPRKG
jgi:hypothetical protein